MQRKHKIHKNILLASCATNGNTNLFNEQNKFGLETEMIAQYVRLKMNAMPTLQVNELVYHNNFKM